MLHISDSRDRGAEAPVCNHAGAGMPAEAGTCAAAASPLRPVLGSLAFLAAVEAAWQLHERCVVPHLPPPTCAGRDGLLRLGRRAEVLAI